jgi:hypothetical protein
MSDGVPISRPTPAGLQRARIASGLVLAGALAHDTPVVSQPALVFNMAAKRVWLSPFIANMIPILILAFIMFVVLCVSSSSDQGRSGLTTMNVIQSSAGFLFILLLAHVNERNRI